MAGMSAGAIVALIASTAAATAGVGTAAYTLSQGEPDAPAMPTMPKGPDPTEIGKKMIPGAKSDMASRGLSGAAPDFLNNMIEGQAGFPSGGMDVLADIRRAMGQGQAGG